MGIPLTRATITDLTEPGRIYFDDQLRGFGYRVQRCADGKIRASWIVQYRVGKQQRRQKIGDATKLNADQARKRATELLAKVTLGIDPAGERHAARAASAITIRSVIDQYITMKEAAVQTGSHRASSLRVTRLYLTGDYFKPLHRQPINNVTRAAIATRLNAIIAANGASTASRARAHLSAFYTWSMQQGLADANPIIGTHNPESAPARDRVLSEDELARIWRACGDDDFGKIVKLLALTGARRSEIGGLRWSEIDLDQGTLTIPASRSKNHRALTLPLTPMMVSIITSVPRRVDRDPLFGERAEGFTSFQHCRLDDGCKAWRLHDLRRTTATGMAEIGIQPHIIEAVLNHASGHKAGVAGIYNLATYSREMKTALLRWSEHIDAIVNGRARTVVAFTRSA